MNNGAYSKFQEACSIDAHTVILCSLKIYCVHFIQFMRKDCVAGIYSDTTHDNMYNNNTHGHINIIITLININSIHKNTYLLKF